MRGGVDIAIRRGTAGGNAWPQHRIVPVLDDVDTLIMSPKLFEQRPIRTPRDIEGHVLLASETRAGDWTDWLEAAGVPHLARLPRQIFDHFFVTRQAIEDGLGIGVGPLPMLEIDIENDRLMAPLPDIKVARTGYVAVLSRQADRNDRLNLFVDWLVAVGRPVRTIGPIAS